MKKVFLVFLIKIHQKKSPLNNSNFQAFLTMASEIKNKMGPGSGPSPAGPNRPVDINSTSINANKSGGCC